MKPIIEFICTILLIFRDAFSRKATFQWFIITEIEMILFNNGIGITSCIRELCTNPVRYESLLHIFRRSAWKSEIFVSRWINCNYNISSVARC